MKVLKLFLIGVGVILVIFYKSLAQTESVGTFYTLEDFKRLFLNEIKKELSWVNGTFILENFRIEPENINIPKNASFKVKFISEPKIGSNTLLVTFFLGKTVEVIRIWGYVEALVPVVVAKKPLEKQHILSEKDIFLEKRPLSKLPQDVILDVTSLIGKQLRMSLKAGTVLRSCYVEEPIIVKRNTIVDIVAKNEKIVVKAKGKVLQNGKLGEMVKVQNLTSKKVLLGKVSSSNEVEVNF